MAKSQWNLKDIGLAFLAICLALFGILFLGLFVARILDRRGITVPYWCSICLSTLCYYHRSWVFLILQAYNIVQTTGMLQAVKHSRCGCKGYPQIFSFFSYGSVSYDFNTRIIFLGIYKKSEKVTVIYNYCFILFIDKSFVTKNLSVNLKRSPEYVSCSDNNMYFYFHVHIIYSFT